MSFDYSANVFKKILKKYPHDRNYVKNALNKDISVCMGPPTSEKHIIFWCFCVVEEILHVVMR